MKKLVIALFVLTALATNAFGQVKWYKGSFEDAKKEACEKKTFIMVDFYTTWCGWCGKLDKDTMGDKSVGDALKDVICMKLNAEKEGARLARDNGVGSYPTILFFLPSGKKFASISGYVKPNQFLSRLAELSEDVKVLCDAEDELKKNTGNPAANLKMGQGLTKSDPTGAIEYFNKVITGDKENKSGHRDDAEYLVLEIRSNTVREMVAKMVRSAIGSASANTPPPNANNPVLGDEFKSLVKGIVKTNAALLANREALLRNADKLMEKLAGKFIKFAEANPSSNMRLKAVESGAEYYYLARKRDKSLELFAKIEKDLADNPKFLIKYARLLQRSGKGTGKIKGLLERAYKLEPESLLTIDMLAQIEMAQNNPKRAAELMEKALKIQPNHPYLMKKLEEYKNAAGRAGSGK